MRYRFSMSRRVLDRSPQAVLLTCLVATALWTAGASPAGAASSIEGVWAFNGGEIAVQPVANGTFIGTVVTETTFAECVHPVGQQIWTDITPQPDGSYWGLHQWYTEPGCTLVPTGGKTAFRVLEGPNGAHYLRVCLATPEPHSQDRPRRRQHRNNLGVARARRSARPYRPLKPQPAPRRHPAKAPRVRPPAQASRRSTSWYRYRATRNASGPAASRSASLTLRTTRSRPSPSCSRAESSEMSRHGRTIVATVSRRALPRGTFAVQIKAVTYLGRHLSGSRTYHPCKPTQTVMNPAAPSPSSIRRSIAGVERASDARWLCRRQFAARRARIQGGARSRPRAGRGRRHRHGRIGGLSGRSGGSSEDV